MLSKKEIGEIEDINEDVVKFAYEEAQKRMHDAIITKQQLETKSVAILAGYIAIDLIFIKVLTNSESLSTIMWWLAFLGCIGFTCGVFFLWRALSPRTYGAIGSFPDSWLTAGIINGDVQSFLRNILYLLSYYQEDLNKSHKSNEEKAKALSNGILSGVISISTIVVVVFITKLLTSY